ncbi:MAG: pdxI [Friedmanniella sp.]|nr:pdxI [Friedmanniella sp.]
MTTTNTAETATTFPLGPFQVHRVGFGAMQLPGPGVMGPPQDRDTALAVLRRAVELGADHIDTAQYYGPDVSNELIRAALHPYGDDLALVSKVGALRNKKGSWLPAQKPAELRAAVQDNLQSLGVEQLAAVNLRITDDIPGYVRPALEDQLAEMVAMREEGLIAGVGISNATLDQVRTAIELADIVCVQNAYSLADQSDADVLALCAAQGVAYVPFFPLGSAFPGMPKVVDRPAVQAVADRLGRTPAQVGLAWLLADFDNILLIPGTSSLAHLEENMAVAEIELSNADIAELEA